ncbi:hypothetical protein [Chloroflexus sp.]|uniref:hypothetical protein n=1 Tax=Chloroflexus sp. TaxID=1904827 RepID=UPI002ACDDC9F|nr:hypothetical protein [Chloroflexus sp.]
MNASVVELAYSLRGVEPSGITTGDIYRSVVPFIAIQLMIVVTLIFFPPTGALLAGNLVWPVDTLRCHVCCTKNRVEDCAPPVGL